MAYKKNNKNKNNDVSVIPINKIEILENDYVNKIYTDVKYSIIPDPTGAYGLNEEMKEFILAYIDYKDVPRACKSIGLEESEGYYYFKQYAVQSEIKRINLAMYHRRFANKMLNIDEIGGYITSLIVDDVPLVDRLDVTEKVKAAKLLLDIHKLKAESMSKPQTIEYVDIEEELKKLSLESIQSLLNASSNTKIQKNLKNNKEKILDKINETKGNELSGEELSYMKNMSTSELLEILEKNKNNNNNNDNNFNETEDFQKLKELKDKTEKDMYDATNTPLHKILNEKLNNNNDDINKEKTETTTTVVVETETETTTQIIEDKDKNKNFNETFTKIVEERKKEQPSIIDIENENKEKEKEEEVKIDIETEPNVENIIANESEVKENDKEN